MDAVYERLLDAGDAVGMMRMRGKSVPGIFYKDDTAQTAFQWDGEGELRLIKYLGHVVLDALLANCLTWLPFVVFPYARHQQKPNSEFARGNKVMLNLLAPGNRSSNSARARPIRKVEVSLPEHADLQ